MRSRVSALVLILVLGLARTGWPQALPATLSGIVADDTGRGLPGATVVARGEDGSVAGQAVADQGGRYELANLKAGRLTVEFQLPNFATLRREVMIEAGASRVENAALRLTMSADVTVSGKRTFRNLADLESPEGGLIGVADAASEGLVSGRQIDARPVMRPGEILETVPGLIVSQHSGEGKANQYYLRGFNLDHGTDFATSVAGVPVNMPTHGHGHGYSDLSFVIPELVSGVQFRKGPYYADEGDFSAAGASHIRYVNALDRPIVRATGGEDGFGRLLAAASPALGAGRLLVAAEANHNDGPWVRGDDYRRLNGVLRYTLGDTLNAWSLTAMGYDGTWRSTDQSPRRAVEAGALSRLDGVDSSTGGSTSRVSLSSDWQRTRSGSLTRATAYVMHYDLDLFSNFTYFLDDPVNGDQFQQSDRRLVSGGRVSHRIAGRIGGRTSELLIGGEVRHDAIDGVALRRTVERRPLFTVRDDRVGQTSLAGFAQHEMQWTGWMRSSVGVRVDRFAFDVEALQPENSGTSNAALASPKASLVLGPWRSAEFYVNGGFGYHSNDARGTTISVDPATGDPADRVTPLPRARGAEVGARLTPWSGLQMDVSLWRLDLDSELLFVGDAGATAASRPSRRWGVEWNGYAVANRWLTFDAEIALSRARFTDGDAAGDRIPGAVEQVAAAGVVADNGGRVFGSLRLRYFGARDLLEDGSVRSPATSLLNGQIGQRVGPRTEVVLDAFNLLDSEVSDIDYFYASRLPGEAAGGVEDIHSHPALPRTLRLSVRVRL